MPKIPMNFQNSVIYKIVSNDLDIKDCYVGSTTNFDKRRADHKCSHKNPNSKKYDKPLYKFIRENGEWNDFSMILVENYPCNNKNELLARERYFIENLKANLNRTIPTRTSKEYRQDMNEELKKRQHEYDKKRSYRTKEKSKAITYEKDKAYREDPKNREKLLKEKRDWTEKNKKIHKEKYSQKVECKCGRMYTLQHKERHFRSDYHHNFIETYKCENHQQLIKMNDQLDKIDNEITSEFNRLNSLIIPLIKNV